MQEKMFNEDELKIVKSIFADNPKLIKVLRKFFFQGELNREEKIILDVFKQTNGIKVLRKFLLPEIDPNSPLHQYADLFVSVSTKDRDTEFVAMEISSRLLMVKYLEQQFGALEKLENPKGFILKSWIDFEGKQEKQSHIELGARNALLNHLDFQFQCIKALADAKEESPEQIKAKQKKDSAK